MSAPTSPTAEVWPVWTDFVDNWRAIDAHWFRNRVVNVFDNAAARTGSGINAAAVPGSLSFLQDVNSLEFYKGANAWESVRYPNLAVSSDANTVTLRQKDAGSGVVLKSDGTAAIEKLDVSSGTLLANAAGVTLKVGANKTVVLTTDATALAIDSPVKVAGLLTAGSAQINGAVGITGVLTAPNITLAGTLTGGTINGSGGTIAGVAMAGSTVTAAGGLRSGQGHFYGDSGSAIMRHNNDTGPYLQATTGGLTFGGGGTFDMNSTVRMLGNNVIQYYYASNSAAVNIAPSFYSGGDPGAGNFPDGTIWIT